MILSYTVCRETRASLSTARLEVTHASAALNDTKEALRGARSDLDRVRGLLEASEAARRDLEARHAAKCTKACEAAERASGEIRCCGWMDSGYASIAPCPLPQYPILELLITSAPMFSLSQACQGGSRSGGEGGQDSPRQLGQGEGRAGGGSERSGLLKVG